MAAVWRKALNRRHRPIANARDGCLTRARRRAIEMYGAGAAQANAAAKFRAGQPKQISQCPQEGHVGVLNSESIRFPVDREADVCHMISLPPRMRALPENVL